MLIASQFGVSRTDGVDWTIYSEADLGFPDASICCVAQADDGTLWVGSYGAGMARYDPASQQTTLYTMDNTTLPSNHIGHVTLAPDGSVWMSTFDPIFPYPGGLTHFDGRTWTTYTEEDSPLPVEQIYELETRATPGGYELWVGTAGQGIAVLTFETNLFADGFESGDLSAWDQTLP